MVLNKNFLISAFGWGIFLWLFGYLLGIILFFFVPTNIVGWVIMPFGIVATAWILLKMVKQNSFQSFIFLGIAWMVIAIVFDYFFLVKLFKPSDGYYKLDVYLYYLITLVLPFAVGWYKFKFKKLS